MTKKDKLEEYARKEFDIELDKRLSLKKLEAQVKKLEDEQVIESEEFIADLVYPEIKPEVVKESKYPKTYIAYTGRELTVEESDSSIERQLIDSNWTLKTKEK
tara:strand:+ start:1496 stop:1804 length:309 start_codon:yes stop_codon:yes gene_type:complete